MLRPSTLLTSNTFPSAAKMVPAFAPVVRNTNDPESTSNTPDSVVPTRNVSRFAKNTSLPTGPMAISFVFAKKYSVPAPVASVMDSASTSIIGTPALVPTRRRSQSAYKTFPSLPTVTTSAFAKKYDWPVEVAKVMDSASTSIIGTPLVVPTFNRSQSA